jgi:hypothetical protein
VLESHYCRRGKTLRRSLVLGLRERIGDIQIDQLRCGHLDDLTDEWLANGISYPTRMLDKNPQHPVNGSTANRAMGLLRQARKLPIEKLGLKVPDLSFPHFDELGTGRAIPPGDFVLQGKAGGGDSQRHVAPAGSAARLTRLVCCRDFGHGRQEPGGQASGPPPSSSVTD